jgi:monoamine oxidase
MHSLPAYWADGQVSEWCGEFIDSEHRTIRNLCRRFGLPLDDLLAAQPSTSQDTYFFAGSYYRNLDQDFEPVYRALQCDLEDAGETTTYRESTPAAIELDDMSLHDWIETRVPGGHGSALGQLLDVAYTVEFGADTADQSALNVVYQLGSGAMPGDFHMYGESDERFHIRGGNESLPNAIAAALSEEAIMRGWRMIALEQGAAGTLELTFDTAIGEQRIAADVVILALPFAVLRTLDYGRAGFDELKQQAVQELGAGRNGKLLVQLASRYWNTAGPWGISTGTTYSDREYQSSWDVSRAQPGMGGLLGDYLGGTGITSLEAAQQAPYSTDDDPRTASLATRFLAQLEDVYPGISPYANGKAVLSLPHLDPNLRLSYSYYRVGQYHAFGGYERAPQGNVYFAGEHCSRDFQGFMEGAAREGIRAANGILSKLGLAYTAEEDATAAQR